MAGRQRAWTQDEEDYLINNYKKLPIKELQKNINRSEKAIRTRANILGLSKSTPLLDYHDRIVSMLDKGKTATEIADALDSTPYSVGRYMRHMKLKTRQLPKQLKKYFGDAMTREYHKWTEEEEDYLIRYVYDEDERDSTLAEVADFLGIPIEKVRTKVHWLRKEKGYRNLSVRRRYSGSETEFVRNNYRHMETKVIALRLGRSVESIKAKARQLGVDKGFRSVKEHDEKIRELASQGWYRGEIAQELDVDVKSLANYLRMNEIHCDKVPVEIRTRAWRRLN